MCLLVDRKNTKCYRKWIRRRGGIIKCWKYLSYESINKNLCSTLYCHIWKVGLNKSDKSEQELNDYNLPYQIHHGIHVFKRKPRKLYSRVVVSVYCRVEDFIASSMREAVFTQVTFKRGDYNKAVKDESKFS
jgi:hypothetical protein